MYEAIAMPAYAIPPLPPVTNTFEYVDALAPDAAYEA